MGLGCSSREWPSGPAKPGAGRAAIDAVMEWGWALGTLLFPPGPYDTPQGHDRRADRCCLGCGWWNGESAGV